MKNLIYIAVTTLAFTVQGVSLAANTGLDDVDFKQIVCSSLQESNNKEESLTEVLSMTQSVINAQQKQTLVQLANEKINSQSYCQNVDL
ncbi:MAG: hypothetical protein RLZZ381_3608 [Cyanobacteriota bacterium]|jgi:hypothetical protein